MGITAVELRTGIQAVASGTTSGSFTIQPARAVLGPVQLTNSDEWMRDLVTLGPYLLVMPVDESDYDTSTWHTEYVVKVFLWFGYDSFTSNDFTAMEQMVEVLRNKFGDFASMDGQDIPTADRIRIAKETREDFRPAITLYKFEITIRGA